MQGGITHGAFTVHRRAGPPHGVLGFDQLDARRVSAARPTLRGGVPSPYGRVAPGWETPDRPPVERGQELPVADTRRPAVLSPHLPEDVQPPSGPGAPVRHGPEQSASVDSCPPPCAAGGTAHPRRCSRPFSDGPGAAPRR